MHHEILPSESEFLLVTIVTDFVLTVTHCVSAAVCMQSWRTVAYRVRGKMTSGQEDVFCVDLRTYSHYFPIQH